MEQFLFLIIFALIGIGQFLFRWFSARAKRQAEERQQRAPAPSSQPRPHVPAPSSPPRARRQEEEWDEEREWEEKQRREAARRVLPPFVHVREVPPPSVPAPPARAFSRRVPGPATSPRAFASHGELRRAIVLMEILGPCRGVSPMARPRDD